ncbi:MAG: hypothetical protein KDK37_05225 [Leptospiraceae bacterium]|nr:hypothetical protein [Leptospiraceae bacterium]MCB1303652.1 hypothetical protein [Leptospiraceae bacterium]
MSDFLTHQLKIYRALLHRAHSLISQSLESPHPSDQAAFISDHYGQLFSDISDTQKKVYSMVSEADLNSRQKLLLRHCLVLLDAVDRNLSALKDRALGDVFKTHVSQHIRSFLKEKDGSN